jgi:hypothetical protein
VSRRKQLALAESGLQAYAAAPLPHRPPGLAWLAPPAGRCAARPTSGPAPSPPLLGGLCAPADPLPCPAALLPPRAARSPGAWRRSRRSRSSRPTPRASS